jgi:predicted lipid-binding transport protein (Tim44 family)
VITRRVDGIWSAILQLIILVVLAGVVLYQLYAVLGRRVGRQPEEAVRAGIAPQTGDVGPKPVDSNSVAAPDGLAEVRGRDPSFDVGRFLQGSRVAYETVVRAFAAGDRAALTPLITPAVMSGFEAVLAQREREGRSQTVEFISPARADLDKLQVDGDLVRARVRFLAELRTRSKGPEGEAVDDQRTAELWTFERRFSSPDPNWTLARVDAAEA